MLNKKLILEKILSLVTEEYALAKKSADESKEIVSQPDMKQEGKYDTRRTEASYLAGALAVRVEHLKNDLALLNTLKISEAQPKVSIGSLVKCEHNEREILIFISPASGGVSIDLDGITVQVTSPHSPLGDSILAQEAGDYFEVESPKGELEYEILEIF